MFFYIQQHFDFFFCCHIQIAATFIWLGDNIEIYFKSLLIKIAKAVQLTCIVFQPLADIEHVSYMSLKSIMSPTNYVSKDYKEIKFTALSKVQLLYLLTVWSRNITYPFTMSAWIKWFHARTTLMPTKSKLRTLNIVWVGNVPIFLHQFLLRWTFKCNKLLS